MICNFSSQRICSVVAHSDELCISKFDAHPRKQTKRPMMKLDNQKFVAPVLKSDDAS